MITTTRNATLADLANLLTTQQARKIDMVTPAYGMAAENGIITMFGTEPEITDEGVTTGDGHYRPTDVFDEGIAAKLGIPLSYVRRLREERTDLYDANVNGWLHGAGTGGDHDKRSFLVRGFKPDAQGEVGIARALLSDSYAKTDHLDALTAAMDGVAQAGVDVVVERCDLTDRRMSVRVVCPQVQVMAETLLRDYRNPFGPDVERWQSFTSRPGLEYGGTLPVVWAGFRISNSETGEGAFSIAPEVRIKVCANGMMITKDAMRKVHTGGKLETGTIEWSADTHRKNLALITAKTTDAVRTFLSPAYLEKTVKALEKKAGEPVEGVDQVKVLTKGLAFTEEQTNGVLAHFIRGGQMTVGGVANAITSYSQLVADGDAAHTMEVKAASLLGV